LAEAKKIIGHLKNERRPKIYVRHAALLMSRNHDEVKQLTPVIMASSFIFDGSERHSFEASNIIVTIMIRALINATTKAAQI
jgi:hypothetical protein